MIHNAIFRDPDNKTKYIRTESAPFVQLGECLPRYDLLDMEFYTKVNLMTIEGHRGCPNSCIFCGLPSIQGHTIRTKPVNLVVQEIEKIVSYGITQIEFVEPNFTISKSWVLELCHMIIQKAISVSFVCRTYVELVDLELLQAMHKTGFVKFFLHD